MIKLEKDYENEIKQCMMFSKAFSKNTGMMKSTLLICFKHKVCNEFISVIIYMC